MFNLASVTWEKFTNLNHTGNYLTHAILDGQEFIDHVILSKVGMLVYLWRIYSIIDKRVANS
jgi:hypothetical protein